MLNSSKQINYNDIYCHNEKLHEGSKVYHYIYGEMEVVNIKRVKTKFEQFNYIECRICNPDTVSSIFMANYDIRRHQLKDMIITFREDYINEWLANTKEDIAFKDYSDEKFKHVNRIYANDIYLEDK